jgi:hypothetical protein
MRRPLRHHVLHGSIAPPRETPLKRILVLAAALWIAAAPAMADNDPGLKILHDMALTLPKVKAYDAAYQALTAAASTDAKFKAEVTAAANENDADVAALIGKMTRHPRIYGFFKKQGLSKPEAALLPLVLMDACTATQYPTMVAQLADRMSQAQVDFCKANMAELQTVTFLRGQ